MIPIETYCNTIRSNSFSILKISWSSVLGVSGVDDLLLEVGWLGETKSDLVGGKGMIAVGNGINSSFHGISIEWVKEHSLVSVSVNSNSDSSSGDVGWENDIVQNCLMDRSEAS